MNSVKSVLKIKDGPKYISALREDYILYDRERKGFIADL